MVLSISSIESLVRDTELGVVEMADTDEEPKATAGLPGVEQKTQLVDVA